MKKLLPIILVFITVATYAQVNDSTIQIIDVVESMPIYPGGNNSMFRFIERNFNYDIMSSTNVKTRYFLRFTVDTTGTAKDFQFIATLPILDHQVERDSLIKCEILRIFKLMPKWDPAMSGGKKVWCKYVLQIKTPYIQFYCDDFKQYRNLDYEPDKFADFIAAKGETRQERINTYLNNHLRWPSQDDVQGRVVIKCVVEKTGTLRDFEFVRRLDPDFDAEAMRVIKEMPNWTPAIKNNKPIRSIVVIPIKFVMH
jgi:TonB family protein